MRKFRNFIATVLIRLAYKISSDFYWDIKLNLGDFLYYAREWAHDTDVDYFSREYKVADRFIRIHNIKIRRAQQSLDKLVNHPLALEDEYLQYIEKLENEAILRDCKL